MIEKNFAGLLLSFAFILFCAVHATAQAQSVSPEELLASLKFQQGKVTLPNRQATLDLSPEFRFLDAQDARRVLEQAWGNPPDASVLGMILPNDVDPIDKGGWGVVVTYEEKGHVDDSDALTIDYEKLLKEMQEDAVQASEALEKQGYSRIEIAGWAEKPSYDSFNKKLYWAKQLRVDGDPSTLNYDVRILGRKGVLVLSAVADMKQLEKIKKEMQQIIKFPEFTEGNRYADFNTNTDTVAEYGIAALIAGGVAAKLGFFGKLFALLLAFKKIVLVGLAALGGLIFKLFRRKKDEVPESQ